MVVLRGCQVRGGFVGDGVAVVAQGIEGVAEICRRPQDRGVGDEGQAQGLIHLVVEVAATNMALVGEEQIAAQRVQALTLVQLPPYASAEFFVGNGAAQVGGAHEPAVLLLTALCDSGCLTRHPGRRTIRLTEHGAATLHHHLGLDTTDHD